MSEKMLFAEHLSLMIRGGIPIAEALEILKNEARSGSFKKTLQDILRRILEGESLSRAMSRHPKIFDKFYQNIVKVGEKSGTLEENLKYLSLKLKNDAEMKKKVRGALIYPFIVVFLTLVIAFGVTFFILPKITGLFQLLEIELPLITKILISFVSFSQKYWIFLIAVALIIIFLIKILKKIKAVNFFLARINLSLPLLGQIFQDLNLAFFPGPFIFF
jgi:type IV pilus assembly protein PilC